MSVYNLKPPTLDAFALILEPLLAGLGEGMRLRSEARNKPQVHPLYQTRAQAVQRVREYVELP